MEDKMENRNVYFNIKKYYYNIDKIFTDKAIDCVIKILKNKLEEISKNVNWHIEKDKTSFKNNEMTSLDIDNIKLAISWFNGDSGYYKFVGWFNNYFE